MDKGGQQAADFRAGQRDHPRVGGGPDPAAVSRPGCRICGELSATACALARAMTALADAQLFGDVAHPVDGTRPTVNIGTMLSGGITPFMHPETLTATVEIRVIEGMTMADVHADIRQVIRQAASPTG